MSPYAPDSVAPTRTDPVAAAASEVVGGPLGRYAATTRHTARPAWLPAAVILVGLSSLTLAFGVLQKAHCISKGWSSPDQFWHACYSDLPLAYQSAGGGHAMPYLPGAQPLDQPLFTGLVMWLVGLAVPDGSALARQQWYFGLWALLIAVLVMALVAVTAASVPREPWRAAHVALSPLLVLVALVSVDLLGVLLASLALWAWGRSKVLLAGVLLGLAICARTYPLVLLVAIGLLAVRSGGVRAWSHLAATALATWLAVSLPWLVMNADAMLSAYRTWWRAAGSYGSLWMVPSLLGRGLTQGVVTELAIAGWLAAVVVGALFALSLERRPAVAEVALVMLVIVLVTGKSVPVQAGLWILPLIALVGVAWRDHLIWAGFEATYFVAVWLYIAGLSKPDRGLPAGLYSVLLALRLAAMLFVLVQVWRVAAARLPAFPTESDDAGQDDAGQEDAGQGDARPDYAAQDDAEPEDSGGDDAARDDEVDPLAGPLSGAPDRVLVRFT